MSEIITTTLGSIGKVRMCKRIMKDQTSSEGDIPFYKIGTFGGKPDCYISRDLYEDYKSRFSYPKVGNILISASGTIGRTVRYNGEEAYYQDSNIVWIDNDETQVLDDYLYYIYPTLKWVATKGATIARLYNENIESMQITFPKDLNVQRKIADVLANIDCKIALNNSICADLETLAKEIYDYWFVQFDFPDENGKPYKSSGGKMVWSDELNREIPEGWEVKPLSYSIANINTGLNPRDNFVLNIGSTNKYVTTKNIQTNGMIDFNGCDTIDDEAMKIVHKRSDISIGDILMASILPLGRCCVILSEPTDWDINESVFAIRPNYDVSSSGYLYMTLMSDYFIKKIENSSVGSIFKGIRIEVLNSILHVVPDKTIIDKFEAAMNTILLKREQMSLENKQLTELRNFLLPMLMNGQIKIGA